MNAGLEPGIWLLRSAGEKNLALLPSNLDYFHDHFQGQPMSDNWKPPKFEVYRKSGRLRDFVSWMNAAPVVSERVRSALAEMCGSTVEFLPMPDLKGKKYFAMNVVATERVIDIDRSEVLSQSAASQIIAFRRIVFRKDAMVHLPPIFKAAQDTGDIFVTTRFVQTAVKLGFTGLALADPAEDNFAKIVRGESVNVVQGICE